MNTFGDFIIIEDMRKRNIQKNNNNLDTDIIFDSQLENQVEKQVDTTCQLISKRQYEYESKLETEKALLELGKQQFEIQNKKNQKEEEIKCIEIQLNAINLDKLKSNIYSTNLIDSNNNLLQDTKELIYCVDLFKKLLKYKDEKYNTLLKKIAILEDENLDYKEMSDTYIEQLDESDNKIKNLSHKSKKLLSYYNQTRDRNEELKDMLEKNKQSIISKEKTYKLKLDKFESYYNKLIFIIVLTFSIIIILLVYLQIATC